MKNPTKIAVVVVAVLAVAVAAWAWQRDGATEDGQGAMAVAAAERRDVDVSVEAAGTVEPVQVVEVKSNASGEVLAVTVETGEWIERGTLMAEIDPRDVQSAYDEAAADLESARVRLSTSQAAQKRSERLADEGLIPIQDMETTVETTAAARAALVRAQTALRLATEKRRDVTISAPVSGTVIERSVEAGQIISSATSVSGGTTLFKVADLSRMQVRANVDEVDVGRIRPGQPAEVTVESYPERVFVGTVDKIEPLAVVDQTVTMFPVIVSLVDPGDVLKPGMNAEVTLEVAHRDDVVTVPNTAVVSPRQARTRAEALGVDPSALGDGPGGEGRRDGSFGGRGSGDAPGGAAEGTGADSGQRSDLVARPGVVFVQTETGVEPRRVRLGLSDWENTEVVDGVEAGERVVLVSVAEMQRQQQEMTERVRERFGGPMGGGSGGRGARGGQGGRSGSSGGGSPSGRTGGGRG